MGGVQDELELVCKPLRGVIEDIGWKVDDAAASAALRVRVRPAAVDEMVCRRTVAQVDVLDDAEPGEGVEGAVDACQVDGRVDVGDEVGDLLDGEVSVGMVEDGKDGPTRSCHALAPVAEPSTDPTQDRLESPHLGLRARRYAASRLVLIAAVRHESDCGTRSDPLVRRGERAGTRPCLFKRGRARRRHGVTRPAA